MSYSTMLSAQDYETINKDNSIFEKDYFTFDIKEAYEDATKNRNDDVANTHQKANKLYQNALALLQILDEYVKIKNCNNSSPLNEPMIKKSIERQGVDDVSIDSLLKNDFIFNSITKLSFNKNFKQEQEQINKELTIIFLLNG